jgi:type VII secretion protein EccE
MWFQRRRMPGRLGPVGVSRLLVFQVIQVGLFVLLVRGTLAAVLGGAVGALAIAVTFGRWRGRWWTESATLWWRFRRRRGIAHPRAGDPRLAALCQLVPDLVVEDVDGADGTRLGMASDGAGWFAVLAVEPTEADVSPPVPLSALARIAAEAEQAGVVMQVVSHTIPVTAELGTAQRFLWVAVRLDAGAVADSLVDEPDRQVGVPAVLAELARRVDRALRRRGLKARALDADGVMDALVLSCDLAPAEFPGGGGAPRSGAGGELLGGGAPRSGAGGASPDRPVLVREDWDAWHSPRLSHRCFWLARWPDPERGTSLLAGLGDAPDARVSIALVLEPHREELTDLRCLIRVAAPPELSRLAADRSMQLAERLGGRLYPLDGEHALAVYGTAPSGGGAR